MGARGGGGGRRFDGIHGVNVALCTALEVWWNTWCKYCTALLPSHVRSFQLLHPVLGQPQGQYYKTILTQYSY